MDARERAWTGERLKTALDNVTANVMVADADYKIIYVNETISQMFQDAEQDLKKNLEMIS